VPRALTHAFEPITDPSSVANQGKNLTRATGSGNDAVKRDPPTPLATNDLPYHIKSPSNRIAAHPAHTQGSPPADRGRSDRVVHLLDRKREKMGNSRLRPQETGPDRIADQQAFTRQL